MRPLAIIFALAVGIASSTDAIAVQRHAPPPGMEDVLQLRDIGDGSTGITISPDGTLVAFVERTRRLGENDYRHDVFVVATDGGVPRRLADAGDIILDSTRGRESGNARERTALWSPDGAWIAYLKRAHDRTELWRTRVSDGQSLLVADGPGDILRFAWSPGGATVLFETAAPREFLAAERSRNALQGFAVDERFEPRYAVAPFVDDEVGAQIWAAASDGAIRPALEGERSLLAVVPDSGNNSVMTATLATASGDELFYRPSRHLQVRIPGAAEPVVCTRTECEGALIAAWTHDSEVIFLRTEGHARAERALYAWQPESGSLRLIRRAEETLTACNTNHGALLCLQESALQPRRIVRINLSDGRLDTLYDPNPHWRQYRMPEMDRIDVRDYRGAESFGRLVYPIGYVRGRTYPLVMVQYRARGFLRGGTGGEYPIHEFSARGYFVLCIERPDPEDLWARMSQEDATRLLELEHIEQRSKQSAIEAYLAVLRARGDIDMDRIAITGMSDGAETTYWALAHSNAFAAAIVSSPPTDPSAWALGSGTFRDGLVRSYGASGYYDESSTQWRTWWRTMSPVFHTERIRTPLLMQLPDNEALQAFPFFIRMREHQRPIDLYIFSDERHLKWQPAHLLAAQHRNVAWIEFWLRNAEPSDTPDPQAAERWRQLRAGQAH